MAVSIKSEREIELMRQAGKILAKVHEELGKVIVPGISTLEIDRLGEKLIREYDCIPNFLNYHGYPASICVSVNDEVVHGKKSLLNKMIPSAQFVIIAFNFELAKDNSCVLLFTISSRFLEYGGWITTAFMTRHLLEIISCGDRPLTCQSA